jgi:4-amino-4-deoxy-L-arabinose transferase-like glycosyltransferase
LTGIPSAPAETRATLRALAWPFLLGAALRLYALPQQILVDDEWHLVHRLRDGAGLAAVVGDFGRSDHSIGLGACAWLLMRVTTLDETLLRLPSLLAGLALLVVVPAALARRLGRATAVALAWLLAVSPLLVFFSRLARPYAVTTLLAGVAFVAMRRWLEDRDRHARAAYLASAVLAPAFHLPALPAVLAPLALPLVAPGPRPPTLREATRLAGTTVAGIAAVLAVPAWRSGAGVAARVAADGLGLETVPRVVELLAGSGVPLAVVALGALALLGLVALLRRDSTLARQLLVVIGLHAAAVVASGAVQLHVAVVAARYVAVVLPLALVFPAAGVAAIAERVGLRHPTVVGAVTAGALLSFGPLGSIYDGPNAFTNHMSYQADYAPHRRYADRYRPDTVAAFYDELARRPRGTVTIVEAPWHYYFHSYAWLQRHHRQRVLIGFVDDGPPPVRVGEIAAGDPGIRLRNAVHVGDRDALRARGVDYVILHRDPRSELRWPKGVEEVATDMTGWEARYRAWFGAPVADDGRIVVFAVR